MPRFEPDPKEVRASVRIYDRGDYELKVGKPRGFYYVRESDEREIAGVDVPLEMVGMLDGKGNPDGKFEGEAVSNDRLYLHSEKALPFLKRFAMAVLGYDRNSEEKFNKDWWDGADISLEATEGDGETTLTIGAFFGELEGQRVIAHLDKEMSQDGEREQQAFRSFSPVGK